jgi:hypothetical protein
MILMRKSILFTLSLILLVSLAACAANTEPVSLSPPEPSIESPGLPEPSAPQTPEPSDPPETETEPSVLTNIFEDAGMPDLFEHGGGGDDGFLAPCIPKLYISGDTWNYFAEYLGYTQQEFVERIGERFRWHIELPFDKNCITGTSNLFSIMTYFDIPNEVVALAIEEYNGWQDSFNAMFGVDEFSYRKFTDAEIEALLSRDLARVTAQFATEYAIVVGDRIHSPVWMYLHTPEDYEAAGITPDMVEEVLDSFSDFYIPDEAVVAFEEKLSEFMGRPVRIGGGDRRPGGSQGGNQNQQ